MIRPTRSAVAFIPLSLLPAAAGRSSRGEENPFLDKSPQVGAEKLPFPDPPVPSGFALRLNESIIFEIPVMRAGHLVYAGRQDYENIVRLYRERCPSTAGSA